MKKRFINVFLVVLLVIMTVSCNTDTGKDNSKNGEGISGKIVVWEHNNSFEDSLERVIEGFRKKYPNVEVEYEIKAEGDYYSLLQTAIQSGAGPDLFWTNGTATTNMADLVANKACVDIKDKVNLAFLSENAMQLAKIDSGVYSVPWMTLDTRAVYYNKEMFEKNGWKVPATFSEFEQLLATIKETGMTPISLAHGPWNLLFAYEPILAGYDAQYTAGLQDYSSKADGKPAREALQKMVDWANKGYFGDNWTGVTEGAAQILAFTTEKAAMTISGSWDIMSITENNPDLKVGAFSIPAEDGTTGLVGTSANGFSVNASSKNVDAAIAFADYCASKEAQTEWIQTLGAVSASKEIEASNPVAKEISESGKGNIYRSWHNVLGGHSEGGNAANIWNANFLKVFDGQMTVDEFMDLIAAEMK